jgi:hypothetical protein
MDSENANGAHKSQRMALALTFLGRYHKDGNAFLSHTIQVTGDVTWVSFVNVETKEQSKQWMHTHSPNKSKKFKHMSACQETDDNCFLGQERSAYGGICAIKDQNNVISLLKNKQKKKKKTV